MANNIKKIKLGNTEYNLQDTISGYTTNAGTVTSVNNTLPNSDGNVSLTIPTVNNPTITFTQGGTTKGSFTLNQSSGDTIALDAGGTVDQIYDPTSTNAQSGTAVADALEDYVTINTSQKIQAAKAIFGNDVAFGSDTTQKNLLAVISNSNSTAGNWIGRLAVGAKNKTFIMGTYGSICVLGAHAWTNAQLGTGAAWEPVYINPDGDKSVYIGGSPINGKQALLQINNVNANTTGTVKINRSTNLSNNFKDVACWDDNVSKFTNDAGYITNSSLPTDFTGADGTNAGANGLVPAPLATDNNKFLKGDGTWATVSGGGTATDVQINGRSITSNNVANILTEGQYSSLNKIATMAAVPRQAYEVGAVATSACAEVYPVIETYRSGTSWYRIYSDGWCEQGGLVSGTSVVFLKTFNSLPNVSVGITTLSGTSSFNYNTAKGYFGNNLSTTGFDCQNNGQYWVARGYLAEGQY